MKNTLIQSLIGRRQRSIHVYLKYLWLFAILFGLQSAQANFSLPLYEPFAYTNSQLGSGDAGTNWGWGNTPGGSSAHITNTAALSYPGMPVDPNSPQLGLQSGGSGKNRGANFNNPVTNVTIYASFLLSLRTNAITAQDRIIFGLSSATSGSAVAGNPGVWLDPNGRLKVSKNSSSTADTNVANVTYPLILTNGTYLVVVRYKVNTGSPDEADLWLNPTSLGNNANIPSPDLITTNNANAVTFNCMTYCAPSGTPTALPLFFMDEIRVSTNWSEVTPTTSWAGNTFNVSGGGSGCGGDSYMIGLNNSDSDVTYMLYTNGVYAGVSVAGTGSPSSSTNLFGAQSTTATYTVLATNTSDATVHWMSGKAVVSVYTMPVITSQPVSVLAATNSSVVFIVSASGLGMNYQWYRNGAGLANGTNISGVTTPMLTISPATSAEAATTNSGYYCIITNRCGYSVASVTNALTLHAAGNIVWQGSSTNVLWDISTTANWTNSAGAAVVFNPGDNVILDDTFQNAALSLQSPYLSPGLISYVSSLNMGINGNGNINGSGNIFGLNSSLLINSTGGTGILSVTNENDFAGGTIVSNGTVAIYTYNNPLGSGAITLAGGKLQFPVAASSSGVQVTNKIVTVADSTLEYDGNGGNACNFGGELTGNAGKTLTIYSYNNSTTALNWMRLTKGFTNDANVVLSSLGTAVEIAPVLGNGNQVFNGTISGDFGRLRPGGGNNSLILNAQNTYNDMGCYGSGYGQSGISLYMTGGNVGFGADSVSTSPPTIDASPAGKGNIGINVGSDGGNCGFFASGGAHTVGNPIIYTSATNTFIVSIIGNNNLTFSGTINLSGADSTGNTNRTFSVTNAALTTFAGVVSDGGLVCGFTKTGSGTLDLNGTNTYTGPTIVSNGILAGTGSIVSPVTVATNGSIGAGTASVGKLTVNNNLTLNGNGFFKLNKSVSPSNDMVSVSGTLANTGTGTITVVNIGVSPVVRSDKFYLFNKAVTGGNTLTIVGSGMDWTNKLSVDGSIQALYANYSTNISYSYSGGIGGILTISWPTTHWGWILQVQTNTLSVGLTTPANTWHDIPDSASMTSTNFTVNPATPTVFYRLRKP